MSNDISSACKDCVDRKSGCHANCERYKLARSQYDAKNEKRKYQERKEYEFNNFKRETIQKAMKRKRNKNAK